MKISKKRFFTLHGLSDKESRNLLIFELIRKRGVISRTEISKITGINVVSVSNYVNNYLGKNLILEKGLAVSTGGRKPELVELNNRDNLVVGLDLTSPETRIVLADIGMKVLEKRTADKSTAKDTARGIPELIKDMASAAKADIAKIRMVGLAIRDKASTAVAAALEKELDAGILAGGAASCAAYAEKRLNTGVNASSLLYMHSDVGRAVMISGDTCFGTAEFDGEKECTDSKLTGGRGVDTMKYMRPWDDYLGMAQTAKREVSRGIGTRMVSLASGDIGNITSGLVVEAARQNDEVALNIVQSVGINLGLRTAFLINLFTPEAVVVGGGPEKAGDMIFAPMKKMVEKMSFAKLAESVKVLPCAFGEEAAVLGAASLAIRELFLQS